MRNRLSTIFCGILIILLLYGIYERNSNAAVMETSNEEVLTQEEIINDLMTTLFREDEKEEADTEKP